MSMLLKSELSLSNQPGMETALVRTRCLVILGLLLANCSRAQEIGAVTLLRESSLRLIRGASMFRGIEGMRLRLGDVLETGSTMTAQAQLELAGSAIVELGPSTQVYLFSQTETATEIVLLKGWLKGETTSGNCRYLNSRLSVATKGGNVVMHVHENAADAFVERGSVSVTFRSGVTMTSSPQKIFFASRVSQPDAAMGRPSQEFTNGMPICFRDILPSRLSRFAGKTAPEPESDHVVSYPEVAQLLTLPPSWREGLVVRFKPRLENREFRRAIEAHIGILPEWKPALDPEQYKSGAAHP